MRELPDTRTNTPFEWMNLVLENYKKLNFQNIDILGVAISLLKEFYEKKVVNLKISRTGDGEILFYTEDDFFYKNIILDDDGDIEFLSIRKTDNFAQNQMFYKEDGFDYKSIVSLLT